MERKYKPRLYRIVRHRSGKYTVQRRWMLMWFTFEKVSFAGHGGVISTPVWHQSSADAESAARAYAAEHYNEWKSKRRPREVQVLGRLPTDIE